MGTRKNIRIGISRTHENVHDNCPTTEGLKQGWEKKQGREKKSKHKRMQGSRSEIHLALLTVYRRRGFQGEKAQEVRHGRV